MENPGEILKLQEKQELWKKIMEGLNKVKDRLGKLIDENIKEVVAGMNLNGFPTSGSCGGHLEEKGLGFPYIYGKATDEPQYRFVNEKEVREELSKKYGLQPEDVDGDEKAVYGEYWDIMQEAEETEEYGEWNRKNDELERRATDLLFEFYKDRNSSGYQLHLEPIHPGYRIEVLPRKIPKELWERYRKDKKATLEEMRGLILQAQEEMRLFAEFLKKRFFSSLR